MFNLPIVEEEKENEEISKLSERATYSKLYDKEISKYQLIKQSIGDSKIKNSQTLKEIEKKIIDEWEKLKSFETEFYKNLYLLHQEKNRILLKLL